MEFPGEHRARYLASTAVQGLEGEGANQEQEHQVAGHQSERERAEMLGWQLALLRLARSMLWRLWTAALRSGGMCVRGA